jgi:hypothetical protein
MNGANDARGDGGKFPAQNGGLEGSVGASVGPGSESAAAQKADLRQMMQDLVTHRFGGSALEEVEQYEKHVDGKAGGLFSFLMSAVGDRSVKTKRKVAMLLELFGHVVDTTYSKTLWELTNVLHSVGSSDREMRGFADKGLAMCSSKLSDHWKLEDQRHALKLSKSLAVPGVRKMLVVDDFHQIERSRGIPRASKKNVRKSKIIRSSVVHDVAEAVVEGGEQTETYAQAHFSAGHEVAGPPVVPPKIPARFSAAYHVANAILKDTTKRGPDIPVSEYPDCLVPRVCSLTAVEEWIVERWERCSSKFYLSTRLKFLEKISSTLQPYGSSDASGLWDNPISMENVTLLRCSANGFKSPEDIDTVYFDCVDALDPLLQSQHVLTTGDFYAYSNVIYLVLLEPAIFGRLLPIPGAFHIGLNAQEGIFETFFPVVGRVWDAVFPRKNLDPNPEPSQRKFALELACEGWKKCRTSCLRLVANVDKVPLDALLMVQLFEEYLPLSLDAYAIFLSDDFFHYEEALLRLLRMFVQLGKNHYVLCISIFVAHLMHWKTHSPRLFDELRQKLRYCSEEEVEIFHSMIRSHVHGKKDSKGVAREVNAWGFNMSMLRSWRPAQSNKKRSRQKAAQLTEERISVASRAVKGMFRAAITADIACVPDEKAGSWLSPVLGQFSDHALPYCLQRAAVRLRGCGGIRNEDREECDGFVDSGSRRLCGHRKGRNGSCAVCLSSTIAVVREMMAQSTIRGMKVV